MRNRHERRKNASMIRKMRFEYITVTIKEWIRNYLNLTDHQPVGQRLPVDYTNTKSVDIIKSLIDGVGLGMLVMCQIDSDEYKYESIDGGHRKRALRDFLNDEFEVDGKTFSQMCENEQDLLDFMGIQLQLQIFHDLSNEEKGILFRTINNTTKVKHQEMLNSFGDIMIANAIRETVRVVAGVNNEIHTLFTKDGDIGCKMKYLSTANLQLKQEEFLSRVYYRFLTKRLVKKNTFVGTATEDDLQEMFKTAKNKDVEKVKDEVKPLLNFLKEMSVARNNIFNNKLTWKEQVSLTHLYFWMKDTFGVFKIKDFDQFYRMYNTCFVNIDAKDTENDLVDLPFEKKKLTISVNFGNYSTEWVSSEKINQMLEWLVEDFNFMDTKVFQDLDTQRLFPKKMKENTLTKQGYVCYIDGTPLTMEQAEAAHIKAWSAGGRTTEDNIAMVHAKYNQDMKSMNLIAYKNSGTWKELVD